MTNNIRSNPWVVCLLPFVVFMLVGSLESTPPATRADKPALLDPAVAEVVKDVVPAADASPAMAEPEHKPWLDLGIKYHHYPMMYAVKIALVLAAMIFVWPGYRKYTCRISWMGLAVGVVGAVAWIALATWQRQWMPLLAEKTGWEFLKSMGERSAFNPFVQMGRESIHAYGFLVVRLIGLVLVVPVIEEFFLRGFLMRFVQKEKWWEVPFGDVTRLAVIVGTAVPILMHPQEAVAALVWFSAVTWLMARTRSIWDCILAHAVTNALLGVYVISSGQWWLM